MRIYSLPEKRMIVERGLDLWKDLYKHPEYTSKSDSIEWPSVSMFVSECAFCEIYAEEKCLGCPLDDEEGNWRCLWYQHYDENSGWIYCCNARQKRKYYAGKIVCEHLTWLRKNRNEI